MGPKTDVKGKDWEMRCNIVWGGGEMKHIVLLSGGESSGMSAVETVRKYGKEDVILLNHDISSEVEHQDIKRFKQDVADYCDLPITPANMPDFETKTPLRVCKQARAFQTVPGQALCTHRLKTEPFYKYLNDKFSDCDCDIIYGFDKNEPHRIQRRSSILGLKGYKTDFPLAFWNRTISNIEDIGISKPITYKIMKHANCFGCLKAGKQHWYIVYCLNQKLFNEAIETEYDVGYSIQRDAYFEELIPKYKEMQLKGICPNDKENSASFWAKVNNTLPEQQSFMPCDCAVL
jgi:hypothetical protein